MEYKNTEKKDYKSSFEVSLDQNSITKVIDQKITEKQPTFEKKTLEFLSFLEPDANTPCKG